MLQIASGMYYRPGAPLHETLHRATAYSNGFRFERDLVDLQFAQLGFGTGIAAVTAVTVEVIDRLEADEDEGRTLGLVATSGTDLINDALAVLAFTTNTTWSTDPDLVRRLVPPLRSERPAPGPAQQLRRTFDPHVQLSEDDLVDAATFATALLALRRPDYDKAIRAIRRVIDATVLIADDVTLAYTLYVAALESLAGDTAVAPASWDTFDRRKRALLDPVLEELTPEQAERVRAAVLQADALGLARRFQAFTLDHLEPTYYRAEAVGAQRPISAVAMPRALDFAYRVRSRQIHALQQLAPEMWAMADRGDTLRFDGQTVLSLEGLNRLCRHVIRRFVERAETGIDTSFDYRRALPGQVQVQLAPQYWIGQAAGLRIERGPMWLEGFLDVLLPVLREEEGAQLVDMGDVLEEIEKLLPGEAVATKRVPLVALYLLWHCFLPAEHHRPAKDRFLSRFGADLDVPSAASYAVHFLLHDDPPWATEQLLAFAAERWEQLRRGNAHALPDPLDAALQLCVARRLWRKSRRDEARAAVGQAVETMPGDQRLIALEHQVQAELAGAAHDGDGGEGVLAGLDLRALLLASPSSAAPADGAGAGEDAGASAAPPQAQQDGDQDSDHGDQRPEDAPPLPPS